MIYSNKIKNKALLLIPILCIIIGIVILFLFDEYGESSRDELYQSICVRRYKESPLGFLSYSIGHLWCNIFGFSVLNLRILTSFIYVLAVSISSSYLYSQTRNIMLTSFLFLLSCLLCRLGGFYLYNWDTGTYVFDAISLCLAVSCISKNTLLKDFLLGSSIALMTLGRTPSIIFLPAVLIILYISFDSCKNLKYRALLAVAGGWALTMILVPYLILGSPLEYFRLFFTGHLITGHSPSEDTLKLFGGLASSISLLPFKWYIGVGSLLLALFLTKCKNKRTGFFLLALWIIICSAITYWFSKNLHTINLAMGMDTPIGFGLILALPIYSLYKKIRLRKNTALQLWCATLMIFSLSFFSDCFSTRMMTGFLIPVIVAIVWKSNFKEPRIFIKKSILVLLFNLICIYVSHFYAIFKFSGMNESVNVYPFQNIKVTKNKRDELTDISNAIHTVRNQGIPYAFIGDHLLSELMQGPDEGPYFHTFHEMIGLIWRWEIFKKDNIEKIDAFVIYTPWRDDPDYNKIIMDLEKEGFTLSSNIGKATIMYRSKPINHKINYPDITE